MIHHDGTGKFALWLHIDNANYTKATAGVAVADSPLGPFTYLGSLQPSGQMARDITVFKVGSDVRWCQSSCRAWLEVLAPSPRSILHEVLRPSTAAVKICSLVWRSTKLQSWSESPATSLCCVWHTALCPKLCRALHGLFKALFRSLSSRQALMCMLNSVTGWSGSHYAWIGAVMCLCRIQTALLISYSLLRTTESCTSTAWVR